MATMVMPSKSVQRGDLLAHDADQGLGGDGLGDQAAEFEAIDGQGVPGGNGRAAGHVHQQRAGVAHLLLEQPGRGVFTVAFERVGADEFGEEFGLMGRSGAQRTHLVERDGEAAAGTLPCRLGTGKPAPMMRMGMDCGLGCELGRRVRQRWFPPLAPVRDLHEAHDENDDRHDGGDDRKGQRRDDAGTASIRKLRISGP